MKTPDAANYIPKGIPYNIGMRFVVNCLYITMQNLINLWETEVSLSYFYTLLVDFPLMGASRPKGLYVSGIDY